MKKKIIVICIVALFLLVGIVTSLILVNKNKDTNFIIGETANIEEPLNYLVKSENGEYFLNKVNADIKFQVTTENETINYKVTDEEGNEIETAVNKIDTYYEIAGIQDYKAGKTYKLDLENANFKEEKLKDIKTLYFTIVRPNANTQILNNDVKQVDNKTITDISENNDNFTLTSIKEYQKDDIIYYKNDNEIKAFKVEKITKQDNNYIIETITPQLEDVFKELDIYGEFNNNITDFIPNEELKQYIKVSLAKSGILEELLDNIGTKVYAVELNDFLDVNIEPQKDGSVKANITITLHDVEGIKNHDLQFEMELTLKLKTFSEINFTKKDIGAKIDIEITKAFTIKPKDEYWKDFKEEEDKNNIESIEKAKELLNALIQDTLDEEQYLGCIKIPTPVAGLTVDLGVSLVEEFKIAFQLSATETTQINIVFGYKDGINKNDKIGFYWNSNVNTTKQKFEVLGKAEIKIGIEPKVEINFIEIIKVGASANIGVYAEGQIHYILSTDSEENAINGKAELGIYLDGKVYGKIIGITIAEKTIYENKWPILTIDKDIIAEQKKNAEEKILNKDFSYFAGIYKNSKYKQDFELKGDGMLYYSNKKQVYDKIENVEKQQDGTYKVTYSFYSDVGVAHINAGINYESIILVPEGKQGTFLNDDYKNQKTEQNKICLIMRLGSDGVQSVYYKVD